MTFEYVPDSLLPPIYTIRIHRYLGPAWYWSAVRNGFFSYIRQFVSTSPSPDRMHTQRTQTSAYIKSSQTALWQNKQAGREVRVSGNISVPYSIESVPGSFLGVYLTPIDFRVVNPSLERLVIWGISRKPWRGDGMTAPCSSIPSDNISGDLRSPTLSFVALPALKEGGEICSN